jgi:hypothetical protein
MTCQRDLLQTSDHGTWCVPILLTIIKSTADDEKHGCTIAIVVLAGTT